MNLPFTVSKPYRKMRANRRNTLERKKKHEDLQVLDGWWCFFEIPWFNPPNSTSTLHFQRPQPWDGGLEGGEWIGISSVIQLTKKNIIIKQKVIWVKAPGLGVYLFNIDVSRYFWIYIGLCIYQKNIYIYIYIPTWTPWARWEWFEFLFKPLRCGSRLGIISLEHRNVLGFEQKISGKLGG